MGIEDIKRKKISYSQDAAVKETPVKTSQKVDTVPLVSSSHSAEAKFEYGNSANAEAENQIKISKNLSKVKKDFNFNDFSKLSKDDKIQTLWEEAAKNKFLYGDAENKKSPEEWNILDDVEKLKLMEDLKNSVLQRVGKGKLQDFTELKAFFGDLFCEDSIDKSIDLMMNMLQAANSNELSAQSFFKLDNQDRFELVHNYLVSTVDAGNLSDSQKSYVEDITELSNAVIYVSKKQGNDLEDIDKLSPEKIKNELTKLGMDPVKIQLEYLKDKKAQGEKIDEERFNYLTAIDKMNGALANYPKENFGRMDAFKNSTYWKLYENSNIGSMQKSAIIAEYIEKNYSNLKPEEYARITAELTSELLQDPNTQEIAYNLVPRIYQNATFEQREALAGLENVHLQAVNAVNVNGMDEKDVKSSAQTVENMRRKSGKDNEKEVLDEIDINRISRSDDKHALAASKIYAGSKSENVQRAHVAKAIKVKDAAIQNEMLTDTSVLSSQIVRKEAALKLPDVHKDNQVDLLNKYIVDKDIANTLNEAQILHKFHKDNQIAIFKSFQNRFEQNDYSKEDAIKQLNILSDQIQNCHKDNQLQMHENIMNSKYSEVQEHAAGNIKNYDNSVQTKAYDAVYKSANQKAIAKAVDNAKYCNDDVKVRANIHKLDLNKSEDVQKFLEIVDKHSLAISNFLAGCDNITRSNFIEAYCRFANSSQIMQFIKENPSYYKSIISKSGSMLDKSAVFKILLSARVGNILSIAKDLGINLASFAKEYKEFAPEIAISAKDKNLARDLLTNPIQYNFNLGAPEALKLRELASIDNYPAKNKKNKSIQLKG